MIESIGELNKRVEIIRILNEKNERGYPEAKEQSITKCWAAVKDASYKTTEHFTAALGKATEITDFIVRYIIVKRHGIRAGMYIRYRGELYKIVARPYEGNHNLDFVTLHTQIDSEVSG